jgi:hypothetical protein
MACLFGVFREGRSAFSMNVFGFDFADSEEFRALARQNFETELEKSGCFDGDFFVGSFQFGGIFFLPLTLGGFLELQIRNHPVLCGNWPSNGDEHFAKSLELVSVLCADVHSKDKIIRNLSPFEFLLAVDLGKRIVAGSLACAQQIESAISESNPKIQFGWWGEMVVTLVRDLELRVFNAVNLPLTPGTVSVVVEAIRNR